MKKKNKLLFNLIAPIYGCFFSKQKNIYKKEIIKLNINFAGKEIIDVGCGTGAFCSALFDLQAIPIGIDCAKRMIDIAKKKEPNVRFISADMCEIIPFDDQRFDIGVACFVAHGLKVNERIQVYKELKRVSKEYVIFYDYYSKGSLVTFFLETLERSDYCNFIKNAIKELEEIFSYVTVIKAKNNAAWYLCSWNTN